MSDTVWKVLVSGVLFGAWPILMNRSGLSGNSSACVFMGLCALIVVPITLAAGITFKNANLWYAVAAALAGSFGVIAFNDALAEATPQSVGTLFIVMIIVQTAIPAIYHVVMNGEITLRTAAGFGTAMITAVLLTKP